MSLNAWLQQVQEQQAGQITALDAYRRVPYVRAAVERIAGAVAGTPFALVLQGERVADEGDYQTAIDWPHDVDLTGLLYGLAFDLLLFGYAHWALGGVDGYQRVERRSANYITYRRSTEGIIYSVEYRRGSLYKQVAPWVTMEDGGMPYVWEHNEGGDEGPGTARVVAALAAAGILDEAGKYGRQFFMSGGSGPVIVQFDGYATAPEAEKQQVQSWLRRSWRKVFEPLAMQSGVKIHQVGQSIKEIEMPELSREQRENVLAAMGVPPSLMLASAANYATAQVDKLNFHDYTVTPIAQRIMDALNRRWLNGMGLAMVAEPQRLQVYQYAELERSDKLLPQVQLGIITRDEFREETGREPISANVGVEPMRAREDLAVMRLAGDSAESHLRKWRGKAVKRFNEGRPDKAVSFESEYIGAALKAAIASQLEAAQTVEDVEAVFVGVELWADYG